MSDSPPATARDTRLLPKRTYEAFNSGNLNAALELMCSDVVWQPAEEDPDVRPQHGHDGVLRFLAQWVEALEGLRAEQEELIEVGDRVVSRLRYGGRGRASGVPVEGLVYQVFSFRDGRIARIDEFYDREQALSFANRGTVA